MNSHYKKSQLLLKKWVKMSLPDHGADRKVEDNAEYYPCMQFRPKLMTPSRENGQNPHFLKNCLKKKLLVFRGNRVLSLFYTWNRLNCCKKLKKINDGK